MKDSKFLQHVFLLFHFFPLVACHELCFLSFEVFTWMTDAFKETTDATAFQKASGKQKAQRLNARWKFSAGNMDDFDVYKKI